MLFSLTSVFLSAVRKMGHSILFIYVPLLPMLLFLFYFYIA